MSKEKVEERALIKGYLSWCIENADKNWDGEVTGDKIARSKHQIYPA